MESQKKSRFPSVVAVTITSALLICSIALTTPVRTEASGYLSKSQNVYKSGSTTCGFVKVKGSTKSRWQSGTTYRSKFKSHAELIDELNKRIETNKRRTSTRNIRLVIKKDSQKLLLTKTAVRQMRKTCTSLTSIRFVLKNKVAVVVVDRTSLKAKRKSGVAKSSNSVVLDAASTGLLGIDRRGELSSVIKTVDPTTPQVLEKVEVSQVFESPKGDLYLAYSRHPDNCLVSKVESVGGVESCQLRTAEIQPYEQLALSRDPSRNDAMIQFDDFDGIYVEVKRQETCVKRDGLVWLTTVLSVRNGSSKLLERDSCEYLRNWTVTGNGNVYFTSSFMDETYRPQSNQILALWKWDGAIRTVVIPNANIPQNGIWATASNEILVTTAPSNPGTLQDGLWIYSDVTNQLVPWFRRNDPNTRFRYSDVLQDLTSDSLRPNVSEPIFIGNIIRQGKEIYALTNMTKWGDDGVIHLPSAYIFRIYPTVEIVAADPELYYATRFGATKNWFISTFPLKDCVDSPYSDGQKCANDYIIATRNEGTSKLSLRNQNSRVAVEKIVTSPLTDLALLYGRRISDGQTVIGTLLGDKEKVDVSWNEIPVNSYSDFRNSLVILSP